MNESLRIISCFGSGEIGVKGRSVRRMRMHQTCLEDSILGQRIKFVKGEEVIGNDNLRDMGIGTKRLEIRRV